MALSLLQDHSGVENVTLESFDCSERAYPIFFKCFMIITSIVKAVRASTREIIDLFLNSSASGNLMFNCLKCFRLCIVITSFKHYLFIQVN